MVITEAQLAVLMKEIQTANSSTLTRNICSDTGSAHQQHVFHKLLMVSATETSVSLQQIQSVIDEQGGGGTLKEG